MFSEGYTPVYIIYNVLTEQRNVDIGRLKGKFAFQQKCYKLYGRLKLCVLLKKRAEQQQYQGSSLNVYQN